MNASYASIESSFVGSSLNRKKNNKYSNEVQFWYCSKKDHYGLIATRESVKPTRRVRASLTLVAVDVSSTTLTRHRSHFLLRAT